MSSTAVIYFSATGTTKAAARLIAEELNAELFEIKPEKQYTKGDLNWLNPLSRTTKEMRDKKSRPAIIADGVDLSSFSRVFLGFPVWWYIAPTIVNSYLESHQLSGKRVILFATSGGSGFGKAVNGLKDSCPDAEFVEGRVFSGKYTDKDVKEWAASVE